MENFSYFLAKFSKFHQCCYAYYIEKYYKDFDQQVIALKNPVFSKNRVFLFISKLL